MLLTAETTEPRGRYVAYKLSDPRVNELLRLADILLAGAARGVHACRRYNVSPEKNNG